MSVLCPTPSDRMLDAAGRPYFLWDSDMTLERFKELLRDGEAELRLHLVAKLMRQAKPDDVFLFVGLDQVRDLWPGLELRLGRTRDFWTWWMKRWGMLAGSDLVAEPVPVIEEPIELSLGDVTIRVDTKHEILVNKLCALVQRSELRDLVDVKLLLENGGDLLRALKDAPRKDSGFSPLTLAWLVKDLPIANIGRSEGWSDESLAALAEFRESLIDRLGDLTRPETG